MSDPETIVVAFGSADFDIAAVLGPRTRHALATAHCDNTFIIRERSRGDLNSATILASGLPLNDDQLQLIKDMAAETRAYYCGRPIFRRLPPKQNFAIQLNGDSDVLDLMIDLHASRNASFKITRRYCSPTLKNESASSLGRRGHTRKAVISALTECGGSS